MCSCIVFFYKPALHTRQCYVGSREFRCISYDCAASLPPFISKTFYSSASYWRHPGLCPSSSLCSRNTLSQCAGLCKCWRLTRAGVAFTGLVGVARTALSAGTQGAMLCCVLEIPWGVSLSCTLTHGVLATSSKFPLVLLRVPSETKGLHLNTWLNGSSEKGQRILIHSV